MTVREFGASGFTMTVTAFDRQAMLNGQPFTAIFVSAAQPELRRPPAGRSGRAEPAAGTSWAPAGRRTCRRRSSWGSVTPGIDGSPETVIHMYYMHPDFATPANSTFTGPIGSSRAAFNYVPFFYGRRAADRAPPEALGWVLYRLPYRNYGTHESLGLLPRRHGRRGPRRAALVRDARSLRPPRSTSRGPSRPTTASIAGWGRSRSTGTTTSRSDTASRTTRTRSRASATRGGSRRDPPDELTQGEAELDPGPGRLPGLPLGRLQHDGRRPRRRLHVLVHDHVHRRAGPLELADARRLVQVPGLLRRRASGPSRARSRTPPVPSRASHVGRRRDGRRRRRDDRTPSGHYAFNVPASTYSLTASKYGYSPATQRRRRRERGGDDDAGLHARHGAVGDGQRQRARRLRRRLAALREDRDHDAARPASSRPSPIRPRATTRSRSSPGTPSRFAVTAISPGYAAGGGLLPLAPSGGGGTSRTGPSTRIPRPATLRAIAGSASPRASTRGRCLPAGPS